MTVPRASASAAPARTTWMPQATVRSTATGIKPVASASRTLSQARTPTLKITTTTAATILACTKSTTSTGTRARRDRHLATHPRTLPARTRFGNGAARPGDCGPRAVVVAAAIARETQGVTSFFLASLLLSLFLSFFPHLVCHFEKWVERIQTSEVLCGVSFSFPCGKGVIVPAPI